MEKPQQNNKNWKVLFFGLIGINAAIIVLLLLLIFLPSTFNSPFKNDQSSETEPGAEFTIHTSKENLNELVNAYVDKLLADKNNSYHVSLENDVEITGSLEAFNTNIPFTIRLEPVVQENGDLVLKQKDISLGLLYLPNKKVLQYLNKSYPTPDWVIINPDNESIYVAITQMDIKSNFKVKAEQFDLEKDKISFRIKVPNETLGL